MDPEALDRGVSVIEELGFRVRIGAAARQRRHYLAGDDAARARDLTELAADDGVAAIIAARGGYGCGRLLSLYDPAAFRRRPKAVVGHSDVTFLLNDLVRRAGLVTFHGPMVSWFDDKRAGAAALFDMLAGGTPPALEATDVFRDGEASGVLVGGCLAIVAATLGTPYQIDTRGRLLFLEDVNEAPFRLDRMLTQLRQAGVLDGIAGLIFGEMPGCFREDSEVTLADVVAGVCGDAEYPIVAGVPSGHGSGRGTLPLGMSARLAGARLHWQELPVA